MDAPMFSVRDMFTGSFSDSSDVDGDEVGRYNEQKEEFVEREHHLAGGLTVQIREFSFHKVNANLVWPGTTVFASWLIQHPQVFGDGERKKKVLEIGSGTGILAIFLKKALRCDITTCDYDDEEIESNIAHNCKVNGIDPPLPHIRHSWGTAFPMESPPWDLIIASDILLYVKAYPALIKTLCFLLSSSSTNENDCLHPVKSQAFPGLSTPSFPSDMKEGILGDEGERKRGRKVERGLNEEMVSQEYAEGVGAGATNSICPKGRRSFLMSWRRRIGKKEEALFFDGCTSAGLEVRTVGPRTYCIFPCCK